MNLYKEYDDKYKGKTFILNNYSEKILFTLGEREIDIIAVNWRNSGEDCNTTYHITNVLDNIAEGIWVIESPVSESSILIKDIMKDFERLEKLGTSKMMWLLFKQACLKYYEQGKIKQI